jgi:ATP-dependent DNA helicase RecQ
MSARDREATQRAFMEDRLAVIVATIAFGMGVDKPNVRFVFHYDVSDSLDSYYQEIGRAGRDGEGARALLFYRPEDLGIHRFFAGTGKVDAEQMEQVARAVERHHGPVDPDEIREETELSGAKVATAITRLEEAGAIETLPTGEIVVAEDPGEDTTDAADAAAEAERRHRAFNQSRIEMMRGYAEDWDCRREFLLNYFGEAFDPPCGRCDNCQAGRVARETEGNVPFPLNTRVSHKTLGEGLVERYEGDTMTVLFDDVGYRTLDLQFVTENEVLESV